MRLRTNRSQAGFSYMQMIATVAIIGIIGGVAALKMTGVRDSAEEQRLATHVTSLNSAVKLYISSGGSLDGLTSAQAVVDKMKSVASNGEKMAGFSGSFVDSRLQVVEQSTEEAAASGSLRVLWDEANGRFLTANSGEAGIKEFRIDPTATPATTVTEERETMFELAATNATEGGWVWDFDSETTASVNPTATVGDGDESLDIDQGAYTSTKLQLNQPTISPAPGSFDLDDYGVNGKEITLSNPNAAEVSELYASVNGSYWTVVNDGGMVAVPPGGSLSVFARVKESAIDGYYSSYVLSALFEGTTTNLTTPIVTTSAPSFHPLDQTAITVSISHGNDPAHAKAQVSVNGGEFVDYTGPFDLDLTNHIEGATILAKSVATQWPKYYLESPAGTTELPTETVILESPEIATSAASLHPLDSETVMITINDPNAATGAISRVQYSLNDGDWQDYTDPFPVAIDDYVDGVAVNTKAIPTIYVGALVESPASTVQLDSETVNLQAPSIALTQPNFHPIDHATLTATVTDPNPAHASAVSYSLDGGSTWETYSEPFDIGLLDYLNGVTILAHAEPTIHLQNIFASGDASQEVGVDQATLVAPSIASSSPVLNPQGYATAEITLTNPNNSGFSKVSYSLDSEVTWNDYAAPFTLSVVDYPEGVTIIARSEPTVIPEHILVSENASTLLPVPPKLDTPTLGRVAGGYVKSQFEAGITLEQSNSSAAGTIKFRVDNGPWIDYEVPFVLTTWPATVETYSAASDYTQYQNSDTVTAVYERIYLTPNLAFSNEASGLPNYVHEFTGEAYGAFKDPEGGSGMVYVIDNNYFEWGQSSGYLGFDNGNWLEYTGNDWSGVQAGELFRLGTLDYFNGSIYSGTEATDVILELTIALSMPETNQSFDINLELENTVNNGYNADADADYVRIGSLYSDFTTEIDGIQYGLNLAFGYNGNNGFTTVDEFHVHEASTATADLWGYFSTDDF